MKKLLMLACGLVLATGAFTACSLMEPIPSSESEISQSSEAEPVTYKITFKQSGEEDVVKTVVEGEEFVAPTPKAKKGYTVNWEAFDVESLTGDITVNAIATANDYIVTYDANGGSVDKTTDTVKYDSTPTLATATREGYSFDGWTYEGELIGGKWTIDSNVTLVAKWTDVREKFTLTFIQLDGTTETREVRKGDSLAQEDIPVVVGKTGYDVVWSVTTFENVQESALITAVDTPKTYTVTYAAEDYDINGTTVSLTYDALCTALDMTLEKDGWTFIGWKYGEDTYTNDSKWDVAQDVTLTAAWTENCVITFVQADNKTVVKEVSQGGTLTDIPTPTAKTGYTVDTDNWYTDSTCETVATFENITTSIRVYAKATPKEYNVTYDANGGTVSTTSMTATYDAEYTLETPTGAETYLKFEYWYWTKEGEETPIVMPMTGVWTTDSNVALVAKWTDTRAKFTVTFVQAGQDTIVYENVLEGTAVTDIPTPVAKKGYNVTWNTEALEKLENVTENVIVTVVETAKTYVISLDLAGGTLEGEKTITVTYGEAYELPTPTRSEWIFKTWKYGSKEIAMEGVWDIDADNIVLKAEWKSEEWTENY